MALRKEHLVVWFHLRLINQSRRPALLEKLLLSWLPFSLWSCSNLMQRPCSLGLWPRSLKVLHIRTPSLQAISSVWGQASQTVRGHAGWSLLTALSRLWMRSWETCYTKSMLLPSPRALHLKPRHPAQRGSALLQSQTAKALKEHLQRRRGNLW